MRDPHGHRCSSCRGIISDENGLACRCNDASAKKLCKECAEKFSSRSDLKRGEKEKVGSIMRGGICESSTVNCEKSFRYPRPPQVKPQFQYKVSSTPIRN